MNELSRSQPIRYFRHIQKKVQPIESLNRFRDVHRHEQYFRSNKHGKDEISYVNDPLVLYNSQGKLEVISLNYVRTIRYV